ncbi:hypothetical protein D3C72_1657120 [compost metagenome]
MLLDVGLRIHEPVRHVDIGGKHAHVMDVESTLFQDLPKISRRLAVLARNPVDIVLRIGLVAVQVDVVEVVRDHHLAAWPEPRVERLHGTLVERVGKVGYHPADDDQVVWLIRLGEQVHILSIAEIKVDAPAQVQPLV